jgi:hypothetical protein
MRSSHIMLGLAVLGGLGLCAWFAGEINTFLNAVRDFLGWGPAR